MTALTFLGTGWSHGVPTLGCGCRVCREGKPRNIRRRPSIHLRHKDLSIVVDVGPDFRQQALDIGMERLDAVFITHQHADHVMGLDDLRRFTWIRETPIPVWAQPTTRERLHVLYPYVSEQRSPGKAVPQLRFQAWTEPVVLGDLRFTSFPVPHGDLPCLGIRMDGPGRSVGYVPDCSELPPEALEILAGVDVMILNALRSTPHPSHLTFERSYEYLQQINAAESYFTHMGCPLDYYDLQPTLPDGLHLAYDGLELPL